MLSGTEIRNFNKKTSAEKIEFIRYFSDKVRGNLEAKITDGQISMDEILAYKDLVSAQTFVSKYEKIIKAKIENAKLLADGTDYVCKYATVKNAKANFPQAIRLNHTPDVYIISLFHGNTINPYIVPGKEFTDYVMENGGTNSHSGNDNEKMKSFQLHEGAKDLVFLSSYTFDALKDVL